MWSARLSASSANKKVVYAISINIAPRNARPELRQSIWQERLASEIIKLLFAMANPFDDGRLNE